MRARGRVAAIGAAVTALAAVAVIAVLIWSPPKAAHVTQPAPKTAAATGGGDLGLVALKTPRPVRLLTFVNGENKLMTLADFHGAVLLNIWATWCIPCREEMPALDRLQAKMGGADFQVVALSVDRLGLAVVEPFYRKLGIKSLGIYLDRSGRAATAIETPGIPTTLLIDRDGSEIARKVGAAEWDKPAMIARIQELLHPGADSARAAR